MSTVTGSKQLVLAERNRIFPEVRDIRNAWIQEGVLAPSGQFQVCLVTDDMIEPGIFTGPTMKVLLFYPSGRFAWRRKPRFSDPCDSQLMTPFPELRLIAPGLFMPRLIEGNYP